MAADASQRKALRYQQTVVSHHLCLCSLSLSFSLTFSSFWLLFRRLWIAVLLSFEIIWSQRCCTISAWLVWLESLLLQNSRESAAVYSISRLSEDVCSLYYLFLFFQWVWQNLSPYYSATLNRTLNKNERFFNYGNSLLISFSSFLFWDWLILNYLHKSIQIRESLLCTFF